MEKELNRLMCRLWGGYLLLWLLPAGLTALYESGVFEMGVIAGNARAEYLAEAAGILLAVGLIPLALRVFSCALDRHVRILPLPAALLSYCRWSEVRIGLLLTVTLVNLSVYYLTLCTSGALCAAMALAAALFCIPSRRRTLAELDLPEEGGCE